MRILGIDPGTGITGYGIIEAGASSLVCRAYGIIETPKEERPEHRLRLLEEGLLRVLHNHEPEAIGVERLFFAKNLRTAMPVSEARGVILLTIAKARIPLYELTPLQVKMAVTGYGQATKHQMQHMVQRVLSLEEIPRPDDAADALGVAIACSALARFSR